MLNTDDNGVIVSRATDKVIGSWFVNLGQLGFFSENKKFKKISASLIQGVKVSENNYRKTSLLNLPMPTVKTVLAAAGYYLMKPVDIAREGTIVRKPQMDPDMAAVFWKGSKFYAVRNSDNVISAIINFGAKGPKVASAIDTITTRMLANTLANGATEPVRVDAGNIILEDTRKISSEDLSVFDVAHILLPEYSLVPAGYIEQNIQQ